MLSHWMTTWQQPILRSRTSSLLMNGTGRAPRENLGGQSHSIPVTPLLITGTRSIFPQWAANAGYRSPAVSCTETVTDSRTTIQALNRNPEPVRGSRTKGANPPSAWDQL
jgi:hypothetical protein